MDQKSKIVSPFYLPEETETISRMCDVTRSRQEKDGRFPRRVRIGKRKVAYWRKEVDSWARNPEAWVAKHRGAA